MSEETHRRDFRETLYSRWAARCPRYRASSEAEAFPSAWSPWLSASRPHRTLRSMPPRRSWCSTWDSRTRSDFLSSGAPTATTRHGIMIGGSRDGLDHAARARMVIASSVIGFCPASRGVGDEAPRTKDTSMVLLSIHGGSPAELRWSLLNLARANGRGRHRLGRPGATACLLDASCSPLWLSRDGVAFLRSP
jgi:hypothetical protein